MTTHKIKYQVLHLHYIITTCQLQFNKVVAGVGGNQEELPI